MSETCPRCGSKQAEKPLGLHGVLKCSVCGTCWITELTEEQLEKIEQMKRKTRGTISVINDYAAPMPCVRDEHGEIQEQTIKAMFSKINEELDELKTSILSVMNLDDLPCDMPTGIYPFIAEEAADTITSITTMLEALWIDAEMRNAAQRRVNEKNRGRGRL